MKKSYFLLLFLISAISYGQRVSLFEDLKETSQYATSTQELIKSTAVGTDEIEGFVLYPNPVRNGSFKIISTSKEKKSLQIYDMLGKQVLSKDVRSNETVKVDNLNAGIYILKVEENGKVATRKLVIE